MADSRVPRLELPFFRTYRGRRAARRSWQRLMRKETRSEVDNGQTGSDRKRANNLVSENNRFIPVNQHAVLDMPSYSPREHNLFEILTFADEIFDRVAMRDADHVLLNDRTIVEHLGHGVAGRADHFDSTIERLMVRTGTDECRQERVMDVDNPLWIPVHKFVRQNLHIASQHHEVRPVLVDQ